MSSIRGEARGEEKTCQTRKTTIQGNTAGISTTLGDLNGTIVTTARLKSLTSASLCACGFMTLATYFMNMILSILTHYV